MSEGVDVLLDVWDLKEGDDKYAFMERMVTDESVTHVLVFSDARYAAKADDRAAGVGTESQIISREIYDQVQQSKFIPIVCEFGDSSEPCLPIFLKSRKWIDFSNPEEANQGWEQLIRLLYGRPPLTKPTLGRPPAYVLADSAAPASPAVVKFVALRQAILQDKKGLRHYRQDFLDACVVFADTLRIRERPDVHNLGERVLEDCNKLRLVRDYIIDWVLLEAESAPTENFTEALIGLLEELLELKSRPAEVNAWSDAWFEAHSVFVYGTFLYIIAALAKAEAFDVIHEVLSTHYLLPETMGSAEARFCKFDGFFGSSNTLQTVLASEGYQLHSPAAELIKRQADRQDLPFTAIIEAELLVLLMAFITPDTHWYPQTLYYSPYGKRYNFFLRATQHRHYQKLAIVTGIGDAETLRQTVREGQQRLGVDKWHNFWVFGSFWNTLNMDALDTLK